MNARERIQTTPKPQTDIQQICEHVSTLIKSPETVFQKGMISYHVGLLMDDLQTMSPDEIQLTLNSFGQLWDVLFVKYADKRVEKKIHSELFETFTNQMPILTNVYRTYPHDGILKTCWYLLQQPDKPAMSARRFIRRNFSSLTDSFFAGEELPTAILREYVTSHPRSIHTIFPIEESQTNTRSIAAYKPDIERLTQGILGSKKYREAAPVIMRHVLFHLKEENLLPYWSHIPRNKEGISELYSNLNTLMYLKNNLPQVFSWLKNECGIVHFGAFTMHTLLELFAERDVSGDDVTIFVLQPRWRKEVLWEWEHAQRMIDSTIPLRESGLKAKTMIYEYESAADLVAYLEKNLPSTSHAIVSLHDHGNHLRFGTYWKQQIDCEDALNLSKTLSAIKQNSDSLASVSISFILQSCSTGLPDGVADNLSRAGITVYAPRCDTSMATTRIIKKGFDLSIIPIYDNGPTMMWRFGTCTEITA